jgi:hypothetical protein
MEILKKEGLAGLYAGLESSIAGIAVTNTVFYLFRESNTSTCKVMADPADIDVAYRSRGIQAIHPRSFR